MRKFGWELSVVAFAIMVGCYSQSEARNGDGGTAPANLDRVTNTQPVDQDPIVAANTTVWTGDYPWWRGPDRNDIAPLGTTAPREWGENLNVGWQTPIPGSGHATPILIQNTIYLPTSEEKDEQVTISILALDRKTGMVIQKKLLRTGPKQRGMHGDNSHAVATIACDGQRLLFPYVLGETLYLDCYDLELQLVWSKDLGLYHSRFGFSSSVVIYEDTAILCVDRSDAQSYIAAFEPTTGGIRWQTDRAADKSSNTTPALINSNGREQLVVNGPDTTVCYDPKTGKELWRIDGPTECCPGSPGWDENRVYLSGGWPKSVILAIATDGSSNEPVWTKNRPAPPYVPSMVCHDGLLYCLADGVGLYCLNADDGELVWSDKVRAKFYSSPVVVGDRVYCFDRTGCGYIYQTGKTMVKLAENHLGCGAWATPIFADGGIYLRTLDTLYFITESGK